MSSRFVWSVLNLALACSTLSASAQPVAAEQRGADPQGAAPEPVSPPPASRLPPPRLYAIAPPPASPRRHGDAGAPFAFGVGVSLLFRSDPGYGRLGAGDPQAELDLFASYDVWQPTQRLVISAGVDYRYGSSGDEQLSVARHSVQAELIARFTATRWFFPQLRAGAGIASSRARLDDDQANFKAEDGAVDALGSIAAGFTLRTPQRLFETQRGRLASLSIGFVVEGGYAFAGPASYKLEPASSGDLAGTPLNLGSLEQSGPFVRIVGVLRF